MIDCALSLIVIKEGCAISMIVLKEGCAISMTVIKVVLLLRPAKPKYESNLCL